MKRALFIISLLLCFAVSLPVSAQQYDLTRETYKVNLKLFPRYHVENGKKTYFLKIQQNGLKDRFNEAYLRTEFEDAFEGWSETYDDKEAFMTITFAATTVVFDQCDFKNNRTEKETPEGIVIVNHYFPTIKYTFVLKCQFKCSYEAFEWRPKTTTTQAANVYELKIDFPSKEEAVNYINENKASIQSDIAGAAFKNFFKDVKGLIEERFSDSDGSEFIPINYLLAEKCPYKTAMKEIREGIKADMEAIKTDEDVLKTSPNIERWIERFQMIAADLDTGKPDQKKAKEAMIKNLAYLYYVLDDTETALKYAQILKDTFNSGDAPRIIRNIRQLQSNMEKFHKTSRHY
ncbi:MAG: hypothetical protein IKO99_10395 [Bacteroidales bacterium]|nr:hypothetical protein [Bacteroidales bacterium]